MNFREMFEHAMRHDGTVKYHRTDESDGFPEGGKTRDWCVLIDGEGRIQMHAKDPTTDSEQRVTESSGTNNMELYADDVINGDWEVYES